MFRRINLISLLPVFGLYVSLLTGDLIYLNYVHVMTGVFFAGLVISTSLLKVDFESMRDAVMPLALSSMFVTFASGAIMYNEQGRPTFLTLLHTSLPATQVLIIDSIDVNTFILSITLIVLSVFYLKGMRKLIKLGQTIASLSIVYMIFIMGMLAI
ncbi:hypothetical protein [Sulfuracidifex tepidarius]|uniref:Uncharacterized protein n=1 Tax=Sulfuracidifex tepidarius TaxID=1294262 RepID=A0A510E1W6_9CREN|nr:hypothetical protein [Sulfuracidifex tepidarius]BBG23730.1 hypothetical protein IC006_1021 [Sulfuracidifex tepidarius]BBG26484.1 hypothetical protein IC007_0995 [Sulfuracidifex tepidarius]